jgi:hypothetical protein
MESRAAGQDFFFHTRPDHSYDLPGGVFPPFHGGAGAAADSALNTFVDFFSPGFGGYLVDKGLCLSDVFRMCRFHNLDLLLL